MKKVCHTTTMLLEGGGADLNIYYGIKGMLGEFEFHLIVGRNYSKKIINELMELGVKVYIVDALDREISLINDIKAYKEISKIFNMNDFDIVYTHNAKTGILARIAAYFQKVPIIIHGVHGMSFNNKMPLIFYYLFRLLERIIAKITTKYISVGEKIVTEMVYEKIGTKDQYVVINSGMDLNKFFSAKSDLNLRKKYGNDENLIICILARLDKRKGHKYFIEAFSKIVKTNFNVKAIFVGDGNYRDELVDFCKKYNVEDKIFFTGYVSDPEKYLAISDIVCLTSEWEGIPQSLVQAAAVGKPLVAFDVNGVSEILEDNCNGYLVEAKNVNMLYDKLTLLIDNKEMRFRMGENSTKKVDERWDIGTMVSKTRTLYLNLLKIL